MTSDAPLTPDQMWQAVAVERTTLVQMLESLPEQDWDHNSLCAGWRVRDVAAHLVLSTNANLAWILANVIRARGNVNRAIRDTAIRHADHTTTSELISTLREGIHQRVTPTGSTVADRLMDLVVHAQDIAMPLGIHRHVPAAAARSALDRIWTGGGFKAHKSFKYHLVATDARWEAGEGPLIEGPAVSVLLLLSGRNAGREPLFGEGATQLIAQGI
ncbi:maleylpyruvate isomerase family mycothiol-dependent enzyme [Nonomuraea sp. NPDC050680]|uniref:maleylpyruvate isomerase family mycothiol-dependent enzyme n=1 Tax=Nonomuraea sp. NPDC050680 TaxID=3154630 RepID=UPI0033E8A4BA